MNDNVLWKEIITSRIPDWVGIKKTGAQRRAPVSDSFKIATFERELMLDLIAE